MKRFAVKVLKGKEFLQSKNDIIYLGDKPLEIQQKQVNTINEKNLLNNLNDNAYYFIVNDNDMAFNGFDYYTHKISYKKNKTVLQRVSY